MTKNKVFTWKIGGQAGGGQQIAGLIFTKACVSGGLYIFDSSEYPSLIRGGLVTYRVSLAEQPISAIYRQTHLLIALTKEAFNYCLSDVAKDGIILYDSDHFQITAKEAKGRKIYPLPLLTLAKQAGVLPLAANIIITGASMALLDYSLEVLPAVIAEVFKDKGPEVVEMNNKAAAFGYQYALTNLDCRAFPHSLKFKKRTNNYILATANDTLALGAVAGGCKFLASYPMTPASSILHNLAAWAQKTGMVVKHSEDEIAAIHMAIGAGFAGVRSMTATSGGGFALMNEGLALAAITETPIVIAESQRPGPATGLPTWTEQGDLGHISHAGHGEFIRIVLSPGDAQETFHLTVKAFNLAEKYQVPVFILLDKYISEGHQLIINLDWKKVKIDRGQLLTEADLAKISDYRRYKLTASGISPRAIPGQKGGVYLANSDEHDEHGFTIEGFTPQMRIDQVDKRAKKLKAILKDLPAPKFFGPKKAKITLIGWGSVQGAVLEALKDLPQVNYLHISAPWPLATDKVKLALKGVKKLVSIENNATGQLAEILGSQAGIVPAKQILKYDGAQFFPEEIIEAIKKIK